MSTRLAFPVFEIRTVRTSDLETIQRPKFTRREVEGFRLLVVMREEEEAEEEEEEVAEGFPPHSSVNFGVPPAPKTASMSVGVQFVCILIGAV